MAVEPHDAVIYSNPKYNALHKALNLLQNNDFEPSIAESLKTSPSRSKLIRTIHAAGVDVRTVVRKHEPIYAEPNLAATTDVQLLDAMAKHHILIARRSVVTPKGTRLTRPIDAVRDFL
ncbi:arsenate reductase (glutaredoxin) [Mycobacterium uberis]|uniref:Arsenate reductase (Glutaredoxin) n=1 Tax=Mycobacterium uberis TaxID=2162698 RepID=A0A3E1HJ03_9MYCO|nr:arsenate reductase (glutaredoxin) [Mycobacterium uberis]RFD26461.1 arsenate reductase (glutaredoxin) [Mycobacterium uberis]